MVELYNKKFFNYEKNRGLVILGNSFEQCCLVLGNIGQKSTEEARESQSSLFENGLSASSSYSSLPNLPSMNNTNND